METCPTESGCLFGTLVHSAHAYGVTELEGGGLEHIVKRLGYGDDPLNQRASVGWKGMRAAERLVEQYMVALSVSSYSGMVTAKGSPSKKCWPGRTSPPLLLQQTAPTSLRPEQDGFTSQGDKQQRTAPPMALGRPGRRAPGTAGEP